VRAQAWVPLVATVISIEFALSLARRWRVSRRAYLRSWAVSLLLFAIGCGALWYGTAFGWSGPTFRTFYICGALLSVPWLAQGEIELLARPVVARITFFFLLLLSLDGAVTLAAAPFVDGATIGGYAVPAGRDLYTALPRVLVVVSNALGTLVVVAGTLWSGWRSRGRGVAARARFRGTLVILAGVLIAAAGGSLTFLDRVSSQAVTLAVGVAVMYAGFVLASRRPGSHRAARRQRRIEEAAELLEPGERLGRGEATIKAEPVAAQTQPKGADRGIGAVSQV
jgi:hypothetical protein